MTTRPGSPVTGSLAGTLTVSRSVPPRYCSDWGGVPEVSVDENPSAYWATEPIRIGVPSAGTGVPSTDITWKPFWWMWKGWSSLVSLTMVHSSTVFSRTVIAGTSGKLWPLTE
jgi:hypothetical protein